MLYYIRDPHSLRQVEDSLHARGGDFCHETVRFLWNRFGPFFAKRIRQRPANAHSNWRWHTDDVFVQVNGERFYLWCAIDHEGDALENDAPKRRNRRSELKRLRKMISRNGSLHKALTEKLGFYRAGLRDIGIIARPEMRRHEKNQIENSHLHYRRRESAMSRFRSMASRRYLPPLTPRLSTSLATNDTFYAERISGSSEISRLPTGGKSAWHKITLAQTSEKS